jgi:hypothetical protein
MKINKRPRKNFAYNPTAGQQKEEKLQCLVFKDKKQKKTGSQ